MSIVCYRWAWVVLMMILVRMEELFAGVDFSFKYILLGFNFLTLAVVYFHKRNRKVVRQHHLLFVTAHPDDEVMFFGPTLASITKDYFVHLLCLSGKGTVREEELKLSAQNLGLHHVECMGNAKLEDGMKEKWCEQTIKDIVAKYVGQHGIRAIFTFDAYGISGHANHQAIHRALAACETNEVPLPNPSQHKPQQANPQKQESTKAQGGVQHKEQPKKQQKREAGELEEQKTRMLKIYYLQSTNLLRKYTGCLQILIALVREFSWVRINYISAWQAMRFHLSQWVWYRKLWVLFSRYSYVNTYSLRRVRL